MPQINNLVELVQGESESLGDYLRTLSQSAMEEQSACEQWTVADVVAHLIGGAQVFLEHLQRGLRGEVAPPEGHPAAGEADPAVMGGVNAHRTIFRRVGLGDRRLATFQATNGQLNQLFAGLGSGDWEKPCYHPVGVLSVRTYLSLRLFETVLHGWDIRSKLDQSVHLPSESCQVLLDLISKPGLNLAQFDPGDAPAGRYRFSLKDMPNNNYDIVVNNGRAHLETAAEESAGVSLRCGAEDFLLLVAGRLNMSTAVSVGKLEIEDGNALPMIFGDWFRGVWKPRD